ncbi:MAG TPA: DUF3499 domain-containing protein [Candidatus Nanopelagicaceae bacterium]|nr:DUF3499 domain-containing protein [Candidatus Nanopelagicaceae bacterium]
MTVRRCSRTACNRVAEATLTYVYAESTAVVGPLATYSEPHCYDLCGPHSEKLTAPIGWEVMRLSAPSSEPMPSDEDLMAIAEAVRETAKTDLRRSDESLPEIGRRGHLRALPPTN